MEFIIFKCETNYFSELTFSLLNLKYHIFKDLDDLENNIDKIKSKMVFIIYKNFSLTEEFIKNFNTLNKLEKNCILYSENIYNELKNNKSNEIINYKPQQETKFLNKKYIYGYLAIKEEIKNLLKDKLIDGFHKLTQSINFEKISLFECITPIKLQNNFILGKPNLFCKNLKNKNQIENIKNLKISYLRFLKDNKCDIENKNLIEKIYNEINEYSLNYCLIDGNSNNLDEILNKYIKSPLNLKYNYLLLLNFENKNLDNYNIKSNIKFLEGNFNDILVNLTKNININYDFYFINNLKKMDLIDSDKEIIIIYNTDNKKYELLKIYGYLIKFINLDYENINEFLNLMAEINFFYLGNSYIIKNEVINKPHSVNKILFNPNFKLIDKLFHLKEWDICSFLISILINFKMTYNTSYIYKTLAIIDKLNNYISEKEIRSLVSLIKIDTFDDLFDLCIALNYNKFTKTSIELFNKYTIENLIEEKNLIKFIYICTNFSLFKNEVDISNDKFILKNIVNHFEYLCKNINLINKYDDKITHKKLFIEILIYLNNRFDIFEIYQEDKKLLIVKEINKLTFDFNNLKNYDDKFILHKLIQYPHLVVNGCYQLSDFLMSEKDIEIKRNNLLRLTNLILNNLDILDEKFEKLVKEKKIISLSNLFRYAYHGKNNSVLFKNCIKITRKFIEKDYNQKLNNNLIKNNEENKNLFNFKIKKTNKKKICFFSNFLTRKHSVFKDRHQVILHLIKKEFDVYIATFEPLNFTFSAIFDGIKENIVLDRMTGISAVKKMRSYEFDKLVFCEIGMDNRASYMANFRMANKQYNTWGHSDTSGYQEIDYFVSSKLYELPYEESKNFYTEKLILQNGMCTSYVNPTKDYILNLPRSYYGLSDHEIVILCPQSLFKIHPIFDKYIFRILKENPSASIVFLDNQSKKFKMYERWNKVLRNRKEYFGVLSRVKFIPGHNHQKFCNLMKCSDILIDPYPFGGCNSSLESFSLFKPLVTQPSKKINGRFTLGFYKKMDMNEMVANSIDEYIGIVNKLLVDKDFYNKQVELLKERSHVLYNDKDTLEEWESLMSE